MAKAKVNLDTKLHSIAALALKNGKLSIEEVRILISDITWVFVEACLNNMHDRRQLTRLTTKLRDAGRRSPPWRPTSSRVPGRPQDGRDGNRILRWSLPINHKFYADELTATLVEIKYYLQLLSMEGAPQLPNNTIQKSFNWLVEHDVTPGKYLDPIQLIPISFYKVINDPREIQSGHLTPLDRNGKHEPKNAFLMLHRSNQLQGNQTLEELIELMASIVQKHKSPVYQVSSLSKSAF